MKKNCFRPRRCLAGLSLILFAATTLDLFADPTRSAPKAAMLQNLVAQVIAPAYRELAAKSQALCRTVEQLNQTPTPDAWTKTREAWLATQVAARQIQWRQTGPMADREFLATFYYSKVMSSQIEALLTSAHTIDPAGLEDTSPAAKGLFALEYLLYEDRTAAKSLTPPVANPQSAFGTNTTRRCQLLLALSQDVRRKAELVASDWTGTNRLDAAGKFVAGGQATVNTLVNELARNLENIAEEHLNLALQLPAPVMRQLDRIEGGRSSTSVPQLLGMLRGTRQIYRGGSGEGLDDHLRDLNPTLETRVEQQFQKSLAALQAIELPLETALTERKESVQRAYADLRDLEILFKSDVAGALGVTITFSSNDGD